MPLSFLLAIKPARPGPGARGSRRLLRVQLNNQVFIDVRRKVVPLGKAFYRTLELVAIDFHPGRDEVEVARYLYGFLDTQMIARFLADRNPVAGAHLVRGNVDNLAVDFDQAMADQLAGLRSGDGETHAIDHVIQATFEQCQQVFTRGALALRRFLVVVAELLFQHTVHAAHLLLFTQLKGIVRKPLPARGTVLAGWLLELALRVQATCRALEAQVNTFSPGQFAGRSNVSCHRKIPLFQIMR